MFRHMFRPRDVPEPATEAVEVTCDRPVSMTADQVVEAQRMRIVQMLLKGKTYGLPGSDGKRWGNFREWAKNQHPVLSMFFAHELHPFSRTERLSVLLCYLCWAFFITCIFEQMNHDYEAICDGGCVNEYTDNTTLQETCGAGSGDNSRTVTVVEYDAACDGILPWYLLSFTIAACTVPYSTILKVLATCGCVQALPDCVKRCFEFLGTMVLMFFGFLSVVWLAIGISISLTLDGGMFMVVYLVGVVKSWMYWPFLAGFVFLWKYKRVKKRFEEEHPGQLALAWPIDGQDTDLEVKLDHDGKPIAYQSPPLSPKAGVGEGSKDDPRATVTIRRPGSPHMTPEPTPSPQGVYPDGGHSIPGCQQQQQPPQYHQPYCPPSSPNGYPAPPPRPPPENPYLDGAGAQFGGPHPSPSNYDGGGSPSSQYSPPSFQGYGDNQTTGQACGPPGYGIPGSGAQVLPHGWEAQVGPGGRMVFIDHNTRTTHWEPPVMQPPPPPPSYQQRPGSPPSYQQYLSAPASYQQHPSSPPNYHEYRAAHGYN